MLSIDMQFMLDEEKLQFLTWCPSGLTPWQIWGSIIACETGSWMPFPLTWLVLCTHPIVLWMKVVQQWLGDNSDVTCVSIGKPTW